MLVATSAAAATCSTVVAGKPCSRNSRSASRRDPRVFSDPDELQLGRPEASRHLAFGHGVHLCLGHQLAKLELRIAYAALFDRFPRLRLAVPATAVRMRPASPVLGVERLPIILQN